MFYENGIFMQMFGENFEFVREEIPQSLISAKI